ncbi:MAG: sulfate transporter CysZ [Halofilum sp. (in: g-proteobacteria)]|nr:sulfate transporter CysZ [Halofilum sp. (in: g-proteobacteria)]
MIADFTRGIGYALSGFALVRRRGVLRYALIPLLVNALLFGGGIWFGASAFAGLLEWLLPAWLDVALVRAVLWIVFAVGAALVAFYAFTLLANLVAAPFNGLLADRAERHLRGGLGDEGEQRGLVAEVGASFAAEIRKLLYLAAWSLPMLVLFLVPVVNLVAPLLWLAFGAWMMALEYADCPLGNHGLVFSRSRRLIGRRRAAALGFGATVMVFTSIPVLNLVAMPVAVAGATALYVNELAGLVAEEDVKNRE